MGTMPILFVHAPAKYCDFTHVKINLKSYITHTLLIKCHIVYLFEHYIWSYIHHP